jgi:hypothetical protein
VAPPHQRWWALLSDGHISFYDGERYYLRMITDEAELARLEEHQLWCHPCLDIVEATQDYVDAIRVGLLNTSQPSGGFW